MSSPGVWGWGPPARAGLGQGEEQRPGSWEKGPRGDASDVQGLSAPWLKENLQVSAEGRKEIQAWGPSIYTKEKPIPLLAADGARTQQPPMRACEEGGPCTARPLSLSNREEAAGREAARRGLPRPALGSTLTLILVASLFVT